MVTLEDIQKYITNTWDEDVHTSENSQIIDFSFDSLELLELIVQIEKLCSVDVKLSEINEQMTMKEFIELINNKIDKPNP